MTPKAMLARWIALERSDGMAKAQTTARYLSLFALALCVLVAAGAALLGWRCLAIALPSVAVGWIIAERNALESRAKQWPIMRQYIDWEKVEQDLAAQ